MKSIICVFLAGLSFSCIATECLFQGKIEKMYSYESNGKQAFAAQIDESTIVLGYSAMDANLLNTAYITDSIVCVKSGSISSKKKLDGTLLRTVDSTKMLIFKQ